jgi:solute carrier family 25 carnitine/acylcarnitine transporter 20/29
MSSEAPWKDFVAGMAGGAAGIFVGHPMDTVRVRLQVHSTPMTDAFKHEHLAHLVNQQNGSNTFSFSSIFRGTVKKEGLLSLYRGMSAPLLGEMANNCVLFGVYGGYLKPLVTNSHFARTHLPEWGSDFLSGALAGLCISFIVQPSELIKIRLQVNTQGLHELQEGKRGFWDCAKHVYMKQGGIWRGLFSGYSATLVRELSFNGVYFASYEANKRFFRNYYGIDQGHESVIMVLTSGGIAGTVAWGMTYPTDVVKSVMQADESNNKMTLRQAYRHCHRHNTLWRGLVPTLVRAYPVNAVTFLFYELVSRALRTENQ